MKKFWNDTFNPTAFKSKNQTVVGVLTPITWDRKGKVVKFSIYSDDGEDIVIKEYKHRDRLQRLLSKRVQAIGNIFRNKYGDKFIKLKRIKELTGPTSPAVHTNRTLAVSLWDEELSINVPKEYDHIGVLEPAYSFAS
ncbi:MAG: hypothetical protein H6621_10905 [Halobacteriovoraceae bacterium]|nr:hypothetical protein [Halobacteriovoraceae bacterium]MCB9095567.1 hypothetical protein [Halobacteriovoraceae bacterium]